MGFVLAELDSRGVLNLLEEGAQAGLDFLGVVLEPESRKQCLSADLADEVSAALGISTDERRILVDAHLSRLLEGHLLLGGFRLGLFSLFSFILEV